MVTCVDTSFLFAIYGNDVHSPRALEWIVSQHVPLVVTSLNEFELANALRFAEWRGAIARGEAGRFWADFEADRAAGRIAQPECDFSTVIKESRRLSDLYTLDGGHRSFDILHVAAARVIGAELFLTFGGNQKRLAGAEGLFVPL